nr:MAG TPA: hypothetical protein [Caudoviricetes sp.]
MKDNGRHYIPDSAMGNPFRWYRCCHCLDSRKENKRCQDS